MSLDIVAGNHRGGIISINSRARARGGTGLPPTFIQSIEYSISVPRPCGGDTAAAAACGGGGGGVCSK